MDYLAFDPQAAEQRQTIPAEWTAENPRKNGAILKAEAMSDEQRYQEGFSDGIKRRGNRASLADYAEYQRGFSAGSKRAAEWQEEF